MNNRGPTSNKDFEKRGMFTLKEHIIPELIKIQLVGYTTPDNIAMRRFNETHYEILWRFWRLDTDAIPKGGPPLRGWGGANWSHATTIKLEAEQWFDIAIARVSAWIINGQDIPIDIMHDHGEAA